MKQNIRLLTAIGAALSVFVSVVGAAVVALGGCSTPAPLPISMFCGGNGSDCSCSVVEGPSPTPGEPSACNSSAFPDTTCCADPGWPSSGTCACTTNAVACGIVTDFFEPLFDGGPTSGCACSGAGNARSGQVLGATCQPGGWASPPSTVGVCCLYPPDFLGGSGSTSCACGPAFVCDPRATRVQSCSAANFPAPAPITCPGRTQVAGCSEGDAGATARAPTSDDSGAASSSDGGTDATVSVVPPSLDSGPPACTVDGGAEPVAATPAFGHVSGSTVNGDVCLGGAFVYLEHTQASLSVDSQFLLIIDSSYSDGPATNVQFQTPTNATSGDLTIDVGVSAASPGVYGSAQGSCGGVVFCAELPIPASVNCGDAAAPMSCPPGCALQGPALGPTCMPVGPENCYQAQAASDCVVGTKSPQGSWTLVLTSVAPYGGADGGPGSRFIVHGALEATIVGAAAGLGTANLSMYF
jgi:hypothetical protein